VTRISRLTRQTLESTTRTSPGRHVTDTPMKMNTSTKTIRPLTALKSRSAFTSGAINLGSSVHTVRAGKGSYRRRDRYVTLWRHDHD